MPPDETFLSRILARWKPRTGLTMLLAALAVLLLVLLGSMAWVMHVSQTTIQKQGLAAQAEGIEHLFERQRLGVDVESLHAYALVVLHSTRPQIRHAAQLRAEELAAGILRTAFAELAAGICGSVERMNENSRRRDLQNEMLVDLNLLYEQMNRNIWELLSASDLRANDRVFGALRSLAVYFQKHLDYSPSVSVMDARRSLPELLVLVDTLCAFPELAEISEHRETCDDMRHALTTLDERYTAYREGDSFLFPEAMEGYPELVGVSQALSRDAAATINDFLENIVATSDRTQRTIWVVAFICLAVLAALIVLLHRHLIRPILWISTALLKIQAGESTPPRPRIAVRELRNVADMLNAVDARLDTIIEHSNVLESEKLKFEELSLRDGLTGIYNRRYFDIRLSKEWENSMGRNLPIALLLFDVDYFKRYNDSMGHQQGDDCLRAIAHAAGETLQRPGDEVMRYGGEEFAVLLPGVTKNGALQVAERIRRNVQNLCLPHPDSDAAEVVTVSLGVAVLRSGSAAGPATLVRMADEALYEAKAGGRNRVALYKPVSGTSAGDADGTVKGA